jgi:hypothetical protein
MVQESADYSNKISIDRQVLGTYILQSSVEQDESE